MYLVFQRFCDDVTLEGVAKTLAEAKSNYLATQIVEVGTWRVWIEREGAHGDYWLEVDKGFPISI